MQVISVIAQKGGVSKSNCARSLAVLAAIEEKWPSAIIDTDPQGTCMAWKGRRPHAVPAVVSTSNVTIDARLAELKAAGAVFVVVDTPPHAQPLISAAVRLSDACIIVTGPYPEDLEAVAPTVRIVTRLNKPAVILLAKTQGRVAATTMARTALSTFCLPIVPQAISQLVAHPYASSMGLTASEWEPEGKAAQELHSVWHQLKELGIIHG